MSDYIIKDCFESEENDILHFGTKRHSGRYPWGSGDRPYQGEGTFMSRYRELKAAGNTEAQIAEQMGIPSTYLRQRREIEINKERQAEYAQLRQLKDHGYSNAEITRRMGYANESTTRSKLKAAYSDKVEEIDTIAEMIKKNVDSKGYIDIGKGVNIEVGTNENKFDTAVAKLIEQGYEPFYAKVEQLGTGHQTDLKVLAPPGTDYAAFKKDISEDLTKIKSITDYIEYDENGKATVRAVKPPAEFSSDRLAVRYGDEGGTKMDGVIELRRGVDDISLGGANYAQVRINVDGTHYLKGMAIYADDLPDGVDIRFNTNKPTGTPILGDGKENSVLKKLKDDPNNPFGATIKSEEMDARSQRMYLDPETGEMKQSVINIVNAQGDWDTWSKTLSSQFLSKQSLDVARKQLNLDIANKRLELEEINSITNDTIRKHYLEDFAESCDADAADLKAAAFPRQASKVILPVSSLKDNECFAPGYVNGEEVVLIRYPHGGTFEIPRLKVNNKNKDALRIIGNASEDAIGINSNVAELLSGADFDGDSVTIIPTTNVRINTKNPLEQLKGFDPKIEYKGYEGMPIMKESLKQTEMGKVSNLITDMTLKGAPDEDIARAVKHSMVVIDAPKHQLDYKRSYEENGIAALKAKYQYDEETGKIGGASTLISKASSDERVPERKNYVKIDPETGEKIYTNSNRVYQKEVEKYVPTKVKKAKEAAGEEITDADMVYRNKKGAYEKDYVDYKTGEIKTKLVYDVAPSTKIKKMDKAKDANELSSGLPMEKVYADYANEMKRMANETRKEAYSIKEVKANKSAKEAYAKEVESINIKLIEAQRNAPRERQAQILANQRIRDKVETNPEIKDSKDKMKKLKNSELTQARAEVGASKKNVEIKLTDNEWKAIQSGAIGSTALKTIIANTNKDNLLSFAMPKTQNTVSPAKVSKAKAMANGGWTLSEISDSLGLSTSTISKIINE